MDFISFVRVVEKLALTLSFVENTKTVFKDYIYSSKHKRMEPAKAIIYLDTPKIRKWFGLVSAKPRVIIRRLSYRSFVIGIDFYFDIDVPIRTALEEKRWINIEQAEEAYRFLDRVYSIIKSIVH